MSEKSEARAPLTGILETLSKEHAELFMLFETALQTANDGVGSRKRTELLSRINAEFLSHAHAEEASLYAVMQRHPCAGESTAGRVREHREAEELLTGFLRLAVDSDEWLPSLARLKELIAHHVAVEENQLFETAVEVFSVHELKLMNEHYEERRERELRTLSAEIGPLHT